MIARSIVVLSALLPIALFFFFFDCYGDHRDLHSFPTRRSSDLFLAEKDKEIARLSGVYVRNLQNAGAELAHGKARLLDRKSTRLNSSHTVISYAVFCLKKNNADSLGAELLRLLDRLLHRETYGV